MSVPIPFVWRRNPEWTLVMALSEYRHVWLSYAGDHYGVDGPQPDRMRSAVALLAQEVAV
jgi:hypothetical protein